MCVTADEIYVFYKSVMNNCTKGAEIFPALFLHKTYQKPHKIAVFIFYTLYLLFFLVSFLLRSLLPVIIYKKTFILLFFQTPSNIVFTKFIVQITDIAWLNNKIITFFNKICAVIIKSSARSNAVHFLFCTFINNC